MTEARYQKYLRDYLAQVLTGAAEDFGHDDYIAGHAGKLADAVLGALNGHVTEYGSQFKGGGWSVQNTEDYVLEIYPLADRIRSAQRFGGAMYRRRVLVVEDWKRLRKGAKS